MKINLYCNLFYKYGTVLVKCRFKKIGEEKFFFDNVKNRIILYKNFYKLKVKKVVV